MIATTKHMTDQPPNLNPASPQPAAMLSNVPVYETNALFGTARTVILRHGGELYRLTITRQNKLILTK